MPRTDVTQMPFAKLYPLLVSKAEKKGRTREEVDQVTTWLTGYAAEDLAHLEQSDTTYGDFFRNAPAMNPNRFLITGKVCGIQVETIEDPLMREIRYLDKLVDELAKGKAMERILRACPPHRSYSQSQNSPEFPVGNSGLFYIQSCLNLSGLTAECCCLPDAEKGHFFPMHWLFWLL